MHHVHGALWRLASLFGAAQQAGPCRSGNVLHRQADRRQTIAPPSLGRCVGKADERKLVRNADTEFTRASMCTR